MFLSINISLSNEVECVIIDVVVRNLGVSEVEVPLRVFEKAGARKFLKIVSNGTRLGSVEFEIINQKAIECVRVNVGEALEFSMVGTKKAIGKSSLLLAFPGASYLLDVGKIYEVSFSWGQGVSNEVLLVV